MEQAHKHDCIVNFRKALLEKKVAAEKELDEVDEAAKKEIADALKFAEESEYPDPSEAITEEYGTDNERGVAR